MTQSLFQSTRHLMLAMLVVVAAGLCSGCSRWVTNSSSHGRSTIVSQSVNESASSTATRLVSTPSAPLSGADETDSVASERYVARQYPSTPPYVPPTGTTSPPTAATPPPASPTAPIGNLPPPTSYTTPPSLSGQSASPYSGATGNTPPVYGNSITPNNNGQMSPPNSLPPSTPGPAPGELPPLFSDGTYADTHAPMPQYGPMPQVREADLIINGYPARTGRIMLGGAVNSDAGVTGQITVDERNFDIMRWPRSFQDLFSGTAFRGAGQTFRIEAAPGSDWNRYTVSFADPNLFGYKPVSMSVSGFLVDRRFNDWDEGRLGGRVSFGYRITPDLSLSVGFNGQSVDVTRPRVRGIPQLEAVLKENVGSNELYGGQVSLTHDTRDSPIQSSQGHFFNFSFEQAFGDFDYSRFETEYRKYWLLSQRADGSGKQTLSYSTQFGYSGDDTPIFENFFAGGYATLRGFDFRGASPVDPLTRVGIGGRFKFLNSVEYMFPITADDAFKGVAFVDFGTVEPDIELHKDTFRVAPGLGLRVAIPMLGPAPLAFDFAYPINEGPNDERRVFSFYMSMIR